MLMRQLRRRQGFTLIELMIVVAIIGILATTSIPWFQRFQLRSKASEGRVNLVAIRSAEAGYYGEFGSYIRMAPEPQTSTGNAPLSSKRVWVACPGTITMGSPGHCIMGYETEGPTYYDYAVGTVNANTALGPAATNVDYFAVAESDIDANLLFNYFGLWFHERTEPRLRPRRSRAAPTSTTNSASPACAARSAPAAAAWG